MRHPYTVGRHAESDLPRIGGRAAGVNEQTEALLTVVERLDAAGVPYMISGSTAMNFYARPRMTRDIDIVVELASGNVDRLVEALSDDFYVDGEIAIQATRGRSMFNAIHNGSMVKVDFIVRKDDPYRETEFRRRRTLQLGEARLFVVAPEDLVLSKLLWSAESGSEMQDADVRNLLAEGGLDDDYLFDWAARLGVADRLRGLRP